MKNHFWEDALSKGMRFITIRALIAEQSSPQFANGEEKLKKDY
jgi:hypothetical protein